FMQRFAQKLTQRTFLGYLWFVIPALVPILVGTLVFGGILGVQFGDVPYLVYFSVATGAWLFFYQTAYFSTRSLEISRRELRRVYVPRLLPLISAISLALISGAVHAGIVLAAAGYYLFADGKFYLDASLATLLVPVALLMLALVGWAVALWTAPVAPR